MPSFVRSGTAFTANSQTASSQTRSSITALADGGFVVVWQTMDNNADGSWWAVKSQRYNAQGVAVGAEALVNDQGAGDQVAPRVAALASGGYVVAWETSDSAQDGSGTAVKARLFDASGAAVGGEFRVNSQTFMDQKEPTVTGLADGGFVVAWYSTDTAQDGSGWAVKAQRFSAAGAAVGAEFRVNATAFGSQNNIDIASLGSGGFVVTWQTGNSAGTQINAQVYGADGIKSGAELLVSNGFSSHTAGRVVGLANGGFVVAWMTDNGEGLGIRAQIFSASGAKVGADFIVNPGASGFNPDVAALADGTFLITWEGRLGGIKGQTYSATGQRLGGEYNIADAAGAGESGASVAALADGRFVVGWTHAPDGTTNAEDIKLQMLRPNTAPELGADTRSIAAVENNTAVGTVAATDSDGPSALSYAIVGGADAARFTINASTGLLRFVAAPNFEAPTDANRDNVYQVMVRSSDGDLFDVQTISVTVGNVNEAPTIVSDGGGAAASVSVVENSVLAANVAASDVDGNALIYSIAGGADAARFVIDSSTGALSFVMMPDFEAPGDADGNNVYLVTVRVSDGSLTDTQALSIAVTNANERPVIVSNGGGTSTFVALDEGRTAVTTVRAIDADGPGPVTYSITGGAHAALFVIDSATGALSFAAAPDFEAPAGGSDNFYSVTVTASDGELSSFQSVQIGVRNVNEGVSITSNGGGETGAVTADETHNYVTQVTAADVDGDSVGYSIAGGADAALFEIDAVSGHLFFRAIPDYEAPADSDGDNVYQVVVRAGDGTFFDDQSLSVAVADVEDGLAISSYEGAGSVALTLAENRSQAALVQAWDPSGAFPAYAIAGGADAARFAIDPGTGALSFLDGSIPDFEAPADSDGDNVYEVVVVATSGTDSETQAFSIAIVNADEDVVITSNGGGAGASIALGEGESTVTTVVARDPDGNVPTYSIMGADSALFAIDPATGVLRFLAAPDFEAPADADGDNVYEVTVGAADGTYTAWQALDVTVANVNEGVTITSSASFAVAENGTAAATVAATDIDGDPVTYAIIGGADAARFTINAATGALSFVAAPNYEAPADAGANNVYDVVVSASDGVFTDSKALAVTVGNVNEGVTITSAAAVGVAENGTAVTTVAASDADGDPVTYAIIGGADAARFTIDAATGALSFVAASNFEAPADAGGDNVYDVVVSASDGSYTDSKALAVTVGNLNEGVTITSSASVSALENGTAVTTVRASDIDGDSVTFAIAGGADAARFTIDAATGALSFVAAPNYEAPTDAGGNNVYDVVVSASDGDFTDSKALAVSIGNVNEGVTITSGAAVAVAENGTAVTTVAAIDTDGASVTFAIAGGADAARFTIDAATGALSFVAAPNYEAPADAGANNVYDLIVSASDGSFAATQALAISVGNVNEGPAIVSSGGGAAASVSVGENGRFVLTVSAADPDGTAPAFSIVGGADAARFTIDPVTGALQFVAAPDYELPGDSDGDNVYSVVVQAGDGQYADLQTVSVAVGNLRDGNNITGTTAGDTISGTSPAALRTTNAEDTVSGRDGHDTISGLGGDDWINGDAGNDTITGGAGADRLTGGLGKDQFVYNLASESTAAARDVITDFSRAQGDKINLSGIDANANLATNQAFVFIGSAAFSGVAGQLRFEQVGGNTFVSGDVNGDRVADFQIELTGPITPIASDFVL